MKIVHGFTVATVLGIALFGLGLDSEAQTKPASESHSHSYETLGAPSGQYTMDKGHGYVTFSYLHQGLSHPQLRFRDIDATLVLDADHPENSQVNVTINAASIDSGVDKFDDHLNGGDFFNTAKNPTISFKSTGFTRASATTGTMQGDLTIMGITKPLSLDVEIVGTKGGKKGAIGVEGRGTLLRSDFGLGKYVPYVGDEVSLLISVEFHKDK